MKTAREQGINVEQSESADKGGSNHLFALLRRRRFVEWLGQGFTGTTHDTFNYRVTRLAML